VPIVVDPLAFPVYITVRDRVADLRALVEWLERAGHRRIVLLDNASTYPELLDYLACSPHPVCHFPVNGGARVLWDAGLAPQCEWFVLTDPDVVPTGECPVDAVAYLQALLLRYSDYPKAGLGLCLDDVPPGTDPGLLAWERELVSGQGVSRELEPGVWGSLIDTTFALYRPGAPASVQAIRTGAPYQARHMGWYAELAPTAEDVYYVERADTGPFGSSWAARARNPPSSSR
jgi:hypothetical protein